MPHLESTLPLRATALASSSRAPWSPLVQSIVRAVYKRLRYILQDYVDAHSELTHLLTRRT